MNLIITCARSLESETKNEIKKILDELGDQEPEILNVGMRGILMVDTTIEPSKIIDWIRNKVVEEPWLIRYCLRIIPIQSITETNIDKIKQNVIKLKDSIQKNDSYRITVEKRNTSVSTNEIITEVAKIFPNKVTPNVQTVKRAVPYFVGRPLSTSVNYECDIFFTTKFSYE